jgi:hypothetical protein
MAAAERDFEVIHSAQPIQAGLIMAPSISKYYWTRAERGTVAARHGSEVERSLEAEKDQYWRSLATPDGIRTLPSEGSGVARPLLARYR